MGWVKIVDGQIVSFAAIAPPTEDGDGWVERDDNDVEVRSFLNPDAILTIERARLKVGQQIDNLRALKESAGFIWKNHLVQSDPVSRSLIQGAAYAVSPLNIRQDGEVWKMADNTLVPLSNVDVLTMATALYEHINRVYEVAFFHKEIIKNLMTIEDVLAYDFSVGWEV